MHLVWEAIGYTTVLYLACTLAPLSHLEASYSFQEKPYSLSLSSQADYGCIMGLDMCGTGNVYSCTLVYCHVYGVSWTGDLPNRFLSRIRVREWMTKESGSNKGRFLQTNKSATGVVKCKIFTQSLCFYPFIVLVLVLVNSKICTLWQLLQLLRQLSKKTPTLALMTNTHVQTYIC